MLQQKIDVFGIDHGKVFEQRLNDKRVKFVLSASKLARKVD